MTHKGTARLTPTRDMRPVDAVSRERLRALEKQLGTAKTARAAHCIVETLGRAIDGMPIKESAAQRLEDFATALRLQDLATGVTRFNFPLVIKREATS